MIYHFEDCNKQFFRIISDETSIKLETAYKILEILQVKPQEIVDFFRQNEVKSGYISVGKTVEHTCWTKQLYMKTLFVLNTCSNAPAGGFQIKNR